MKIKKIQTTMQLTPEAKQMMKEDSASIGLSGASYIEKLIRENHVRMQKEKKNEARG